MIPVSLQGCSVLCVDDDPDAVDLLQELLKERGADVRTASRAADALAALEGWTPHVVILDMAMPGEDGCSLLQRIHAREDTRDVRAIALTARAYAADRARTREAGFDRHLTKPMEISDLVNAVAELSAASVGETTESGVRDAVPTSPTRGTG